VEAGEVVAAVSLLVALRVDVISCAVVDAALALVVCSCTVVPDVVFIL